MIVANLEQARLDQPARPLLHGGGRQARFGGNFGVGPAAIDLQFPNDGPISIVNFECLRPGLSLVGDLRVILRSFNFKVKRLLRQSGKPGSAASNRPETRNSTRIKQLFRMFAS